MQRFSRSLLAQMQRDFVAAKLAVAKNAPRWKERNEDKLTDGRRESEGSRRCGARERKSASTTRAERREGERESLEPPRCGTKDKILKISAQKSPQHGATGLMAVRHAKSFGETRYRPPLVLRRLAFKRRENRKLDYF